MKKLLFILIGIVFFNTIINSYHSNCHDNYCDDGSEEYNALEVGVWRMSKQDHIRHGDRDAYYYY